MPYQITQHLSAGKILTVTADSLSSGTVQRVAQPGDNTTAYPLQSVAVSTSLVLGPYTNERQYSIVTLNGTLSYTLTSQDQSASQLPVTAMAADGAIALARGLVVFTKSASAIAATLAAPTAEQEGLVMQFTAGAAKAHVITATGLLQDGITGGAKDTATFAAFLGASLTLIAYNLKWHVLSLNACTIA